MAGARAFSTLASFHRTVDGEVVYCCCNCQVPIGDTYDWNGKLESDNVVLLKAVSEFVKHGKTIISSDVSDDGSKYQPLYCGNCGSELGKFYSSVPVHLTYKLNFYNIDNTAITEYTLGENLSQNIPTSEAPLTLEACQYFKEEFKKQKVLLEMLVERMSKVENVLPPEQNS